MELTDAKKIFVEELYTKDTSHFIDDTIEQINPSLRLLQEKVNAYNKQVKELQDTFYLENINLVNQVSELLEKLDSYTYTLQKEVTIAEQHSVLIFTLLRYYKMNKNMYATPIKLSKLNKFLGTSYTRQDIVDIVLDKNNVSLIRKNADAFELTKKDIGFFLYWVGKGELSFKN